MTTHSRQLLLGAHMSIAGGFEKAIIRGQSIHCTAIQMFTKSNRQWEAKPITDEQAELFKQQLKDSSIEVIVAHAMYLLNLASPDSKTWHGTIHAVKKELQRCHTLGIPYLVVHPGSRLTSPLDDALDRVAQALNRIFDEEHGGTTLLLENMAGQGSTVARKFEELATILDKVHHKRRIGTCLDTCHAFAAGYDFSTPEAYKKTWKEFDNTIGLQHLKAIHLNDSKQELGSHVDRHEEIGDGKMKIETFSLLMNDPHLFSIPKILETPNDDLSHYARNMKRLKGLISTKNKKLLKVSE